MQFDIKPEILAPAGTLDAVPAVLDAGGDAVYLGGKKFNMRQHRSSYNLTDREIAQAIQITHEKNKKIYITLNNMIFESELSEVRELLAMFGELKPDALIVQDLGLAAMAREICVHIPLHASTMMNIHSVESAQALKMMGFTRVITSRDIPLHEVKQISEQSGLEMEYFVHGDMCIAQSSQCLLSGLIFGESSNRGRCMKPCRWEWQLTTENNVGLNGMSKGYLLARKDMCMLPHILELVQNRVASFKIEGRMRSMEFVVPIVSLYRQALDAYFENPDNYTCSQELIDQINSHRVRNYSTCHALGKPNSTSIDISGKREPRFFSHASGDLPLTIDREQNATTIENDFELIVHLSNLTAAQAAADAGADAIYLAGDEFVQHPSQLDIHTLTEFVERMTKRNIRVAVLGARISDECEMVQWRQQLKKLSRIKQLAVGVSNLGALKAAQEMRIKNIIADFSLNTCNSVAADELSTMAVDRVTASIELDYEETRNYIQKSRLPVEVIGQGPLPGMLLEYCTISAALGKPPLERCSAICRGNKFTLNDKTGHSYLVECDRRCRNHLFSPADICVLPNLELIASTGAVGIRIEAQLDEPETISIIVSTYRQAIDAMQIGEQIDTQNVLDKIRNTTGRELCDGAFDFNTLPQFDGADLCRRKNLLAL